MKRTLILFAILATLSAAGLLGGTYMLLMHPFYTAGAVLLAINIVVFSIFKLG